MPLDKFPVASPVEARDLFIPWICPDCGSTYWHQPGTLHEQPRIKDPEKWPDHFDPMLSSESPEPGPEDYEWTLSNGEPAPKCCLAALIRGGRRVDWLQRFIQRHHDYASRKA